MSKRLEENPKQIAEALAYFIDDGPVSGAHEEPDWHFMPDERALDYPDLESVLEQWAE